MNVLSIECYSDEASNGDTFAVIVDGSKYAWNLDFDEALGCIARTMLGKDSPGTLHYRDTYLKSQNQAKKFGLGADFLPTITQLREGT